MYIIGKSKKKYTLKILQEESKKKVQNRKNFKKDSEKEKIEKNKNISTSNSKIDTKKHSVKNQNPSKKKKIQEKK